MLIFLEIHFNFEGKITFDYLILSLVKVGGILGNVKACAKQFLPVAHVTIRPICGAQYN